MFWVPVALVEVHFFEAGTFTFFAQMKRLWMCLEGECETELSHPFLPPVANNVPIPVFEECFLHRSLHVRSNLKTFVEKWGLQYCQMPRWWFTSHPVFHWFRLYNFKSIVWNYFCEWRMQHRWGRTLNENDMGPHYLSRYFYCVNSDIFIYCVCQV